MSPGERLGGPKRVDAEGKFERIILIISGAASKVTYLPRLQSGSMRFKVTAAEATNLARSRRQD